MRQTRRYSVRRRVFALHDLKRVAAVFERQAQLAKKSAHRCSLQYGLHFSDNTSFEADSASILDDQSIVDAKRPVQVEFYFRNYSLDERSLTFSIRHGSSEFGNEIVVSGTEADWVNDNFTRLREAIDAAKPQSGWPADHPAVLLNLVALGLGSLGMLVIDVLVRHVVPDTFPAPDSAWMQALGDFCLSHRLIVYGLLWAWRWLAGFFWGAVPLTDWILRAWPNIELDFGVEHLKKEKAERERILAVVTLVVLPVLLTLGIDLARRLT